VTDTLNRIVFWCVIGVIAITVWSYHQTIANYALVTLIFVANGLDETTWRFWVILSAAAFWVYTYRANRRRQEAMIELLCDIKNKLQ
jgi:hypothetical protein